MESLTKGLNNGTDSGRIVLTMRYTIFLMFLLICAGFQDQQDKEEGDAPEQDAIDRAIENGAKYLLKLETPSASQKRTDELVLLTLIHAGYNEKDWQVRSLLKRILSKRLTATYNVALQAVALQQLNAKKYQRKILECAMFLVYAQCANGQWSYGGVSDLPTISGAIYTKFHDARKSVSTGTDKDEEDEKEPDKVIELKFRKKLTPTGSGDNSNTHYAILGLRACAEAGIIFPEETIKRALEWWYNAQNSDGGWGYPGKGYTNQGSKGSMTVAGVSSLSILLWISGKDWKEDPAVKRGVEWISKNFTVEANPGKTYAGNSWHYYYLYGLERAGVIYNTDLFGKRKWYKEGADYLLSAQKKDGTWPDPVIDTCFAILFLKRATKELDKSKIPQKDERKFIPTGKGK